MVNQKSFDFLVFVAVQVHRFDPLVEKEIQSAVEHALFLAFDVDFENQGIPREVELVQPLARHGDPLRGQGIGGCILDGGKHMRNCSADEIQRSIEIGKGDVMGLDSEFLGVNGEP